MRDNGTTRQTARTALNGSSVQSPCDGVVLDARRDYLPDRWFDGSVVFGGGSLTFAIPSEIAVTFGGAGTGTVKLTYSSGSGEGTTCSYRGDGARTYLFTKCADEDGDEEALLAGTTVSADGFRLARGHR
jgi:hypothetical protein